MDDARLVREVMVAVEAIIVQAFTSTIGRRRDGAAPLRAANDLNGEMEDRHNDRPFTTLSARRHDV
jgi:hypothetical protein